MVLHAKFGYPRPYNFGQEVFTDFLLLFFFPFCCCGNQRFNRNQILLALSQTETVFYFVSAVTVLQFLLFPVFSTFLENFLSFSENLKLPSANFLSLEGSKICCLGKGQEFLKRAM